MSDEAGVAVVRPGRLHGERAGRERDVLRASRTLADPGTFVGVLLSRGVPPAAEGILVGDRLRELVSLDHRHAVEQAGDPALTKFAPQLDPMSGMYGRFVKATSPYGEGAFTHELPLKPCHAQKPPPCRVEAVGMRALRRHDDVLRVAIRFGRDVAEVRRPLPRLSRRARDRSRPKAPGATCRPRCPPARRRSDTGCAAPTSGRRSTPAGTPSQYWVTTPDQSSLLVPRPLNSACRRGATPRRRS